MREETYSQELARTGKVSVEFPEWYWEAFLTCWFPEMAGLWDLFLTRRSFSGSTTRLCISDSSMSVSTGISTRAKRLLAVQTTQMFRTQSVPKAVEVFHISSTWGGRKEGERGCVDSKRVSSISKATGDLTSKELYASLSLTC